jgi:myo-inositol-1(or 4)-monophosphatase
MKISNADIVASWLREATDRIARTAIPPGVEDNVSQLIQRVHAISEKAKTFMRAALAEQYPDIGWSTSEAEVDPDMPFAESYWIYDPIDGAYHYLQGLPLWSSSLTLISKERPVFSLVYDPSLGELFMAAESEGSTMNGVALRVSQKANVKSAVVGTSIPPFGYGDPIGHRRSIALLDTISQRVFNVRQMASGSLQLAYVAAGRLDAYLEAGNDVYDWMAGALLVSEAGGEVTDLDGSPFGLSAGGIAAAPGALRAPLLDGITAHLDGVRS